MKVLLISPLAPEVHSQNIDFNEKVPVGSVLRARLPREDELNFMLEDRDTPIFFIKIKEKDDFIIYKRESQHFKILK